MVVKLLVKFIRTSSVDGLFKVLRLRSGDHRPVPWYLRYKVELRDLVEMMVEVVALAGAHDDHAWIQRDVPELEKRWNRFARLAGRSWRVDETYVKIKGRWTISTVPSTKRERPSIPAARQTGRRGGQGLLPAGDHRQGRLPQKMRSMAIRPLIGRSKRLSANIPRAINARSDRQTN